MNREQRTYRTLKSVAEARQIFLSRFAGRALRTEVVPVRQALGRYSAHAVAAARSVPAYHGSAVDGVAVKASATFGALPESPVLHAAGVAAIAVNTGDPLPAGADAVVMVEKITDRGDHFEIREAVYPWQNVRKAGEDIVRGEILLPARQRIGPIDQAALLAAGVLEIEVISRPRVLIIPTGNEIIRPEDALEATAPGAILEVNGQMLASLAAECGGDAIIHDIVADDPARILAAVQSGVAAAYDLLLLIAGSSAGSRDHAPTVLSGAGELLVHGVSVMPGKPTLLAAVDGCPVVGVPGFPVSAMVAFREFARPMLYQLQGLLAPEQETVPAVLGRKIPSRPGVEEHVRVILGKVGERVVAVPVGGGAGALMSVVRAGGILRIPSETSGCSEGEVRPIHVLVSPDSVDQRLIGIGSHDLTVDILRSLIQEKSGGRFTISSTNVGSMGGLLAVDKGIAHFAGCHLLDPDTGEYNRPYIARFVKNRPVTVVTVVHRWQGLMVSKANPKGIQSVRDLARPEVRFINRQAGSGTRVLLDYELSRAQIAAEAIHGYTSEEYTHMNIAMAVASGRADTGLGIMAAARALDLDFIPITRERYDFVIPTELIDDENVRALLEQIRSADFRRQVCAMGGYEVEETGKMVI
jgi:molybdenum cofactor synthesis domain-containing protein